MKIIGVVTALALLVPAVLAAQQPPVPPAPPAPAVAPPSPVSRPLLDLGKWWKNSQIVRDLQLSEDQIKSLEKIFLESRPRLGEMRAELRRREAVLQSLLDTDPPDQKKIEEQTDQTLEARGKLEKANTAMMVAFRRVLSAEQWKKLKEIRQARKEVPPPPPPSAPPPPPAPPAPPREVGKTASGDPIYAVSGRLKPPVLLQNRNPDYTPEAKDKHIEGIVILQAVVKKDGTVQDVKVLQSLGYGLDEAATDTLKKEWRFQPGTLDGKPVDVRATIEISFRLY